MRPPRVIEPGTAPGGAVPYAATGALCPSPPASTRATRSVSRQTGAGQAGATGRSRPRTRGARQRGPWLGRPRSSPFRELTTVPPAWPGGRVNGLRMASTSRSPGHRAPRSCRTPPRGTARCFWARRQHPAQILRWFRPLQRRLTLPLRPALEPDVEDADLEGARRVGRQPGEPDHHVASVRGRAEPDTYPAACPGLPGHHRQVRQ
jgi:hypothetical protein